MVRTLANGATKASGGKAPGKQVGQSNSSPSSDGSSSNSSGVYNGGGNTMKMWPTPDWQKGVGSFFPKINNNNSSNATSTSVKPEGSPSESASSCSASSMEQPGVSTKDLEIESQ